jgi:hypothetical protein
MRRIDEIIVHHTATGLDYTTEDIRRMHIEERGWDDIGYHVVIESDGQIVAGRHISKVGAHAKNRNRHSIGVAAIGDNTVEGKEWTAAQRFVLPVVLRTLQMLFPGAKVIGHRDVRDTACPGFAFNWHFND